MFAYCVNNPVNYSDYTGTEVAAATVCAVIASIELVLTFLSWVVIVVVGVAVVARIVDAVTSLIEALSEESSDESAVAPQEAQVTPASPQPPNNNNSDDDKNGNNKNSNNKHSFKRVTDYLLKRAQLDAHSIKHEYLGKSAPVKFYNLFYDTLTGIIYILDNKGNIVAETIYSIFGDMLPR